MLEGHLTVLEVILLLEGSLDSAGYDVGVDTEPVAVGVGVDVVHWWLLQLDESDLSLGQGPFPLERLSTSLIRESKIFMLA
jgi:hypothetical protein